MKKLFAAILLSAFATAPAFAAGSIGNIGINTSLDGAFSLDGALGLQGEFNISSKVPISVQAFWKKETTTVFGYDNDHSALGVTGIYDLSSVTQVDKIGAVGKKMTPYVGLGLARETKNVTVGFPGFFGTVKTTKTELYFTGGMRYEFVPNLAADVSYNNIFDLTVGLNYSF